MFHQLVLFRYDVSLRANSRVAFLLAMFGILGKVDAQESVAPQNTGEDVQVASDDEDVRQWITDLASPTATIRESATKELLSAGRRVMPALWPALESEDREVRARAEIVAQTLERSSAESLKERGFKIDSHKRTGAVRSVTVADQVIERNDIRDMQFLYRLGSLYLRDARFSAEALARLGEIDQLQALHVGCETGNCNASQFSDDWLTHIAQLRRLRGLVLPNTEISDAGLKELENLEVLEMLYFGASQIRGGGIAHLAHLPLRRLGIRESKLKDQSLIDALREFRADGPLEELAIENCPISNATVSAISRIRSLEVIDLSGTRITNEGLKSLARLPHLRSLQVQRTDISDDGLRSITDYPEIVHLDVRDTRVTFNGLLKLGTSKSLQSVEQNCPLTEEQAYQLREAWPWLRSNR